MVASGKYSEIWFSSRSILALHTATENWVQVESWLAPRLTTITLGSNPPSRQRLSQWNADASRLEANGL